MKQKMMLAAIAAVVGVGGFAGFNAYQNNSSASDILLANAEALTDIELDPVEVFCNTGGHGRCYFPVKYGLVTNDDFTKCFFLE